MSRLTGKDALGLFEAYNAVYTPQEEISEEQIWEEVEEWVNSLVEEGHDLSEFSWEEMYDAYLDEAGSPGGAIAATQARQRQAQAASAKQGLQQGKTFGVSGNLGFQSGTKVKMDSAATKSQGRTVLRSTTPQGAGPRAGTSQSRPNQINLGGQKLYAAKLGGKDVYVGAKKPGQTPASPTKPAATTPAKPARPAAPTSARPAATARPSAAPAARPAATAAAKPAPSAAAKPAPSATAKPATPAPQPKIKQDVADIKSMQAASQARQAAPSPAAAKPAAKPTPAATGSKKPGSIVSGFDMFDVVKGHLIDEGYADTEEAAIAIMANMSEEWKASIIAEEQLDEISLKTKMSAFKKRATHDFESDSDDDNYTKSGENKTDKIKANIVKKHGKKAGEHAERAAHAGIFGRKSFSMPKKP